MDDEHKKILEGIRNIVVAQFQFIHKDAADQKFRDDVARKETQKVEVTNFPDGGGSGGGGGGAPSADVDKKSGGLLKKLGIGMKFLAMGLTALSNPALFIGIGVLTALILGIGGAIGLLAKFLGQDIANFIESLMIAIANGFVHFVKLMSENKEAVQDVIDLFFYFVDGAIEAFGKFMEVVMPHIKDILQMFLDFLPDLIVAVTPIVQAILDFVVDMTEAITPIIKIIADALVKIVTVLVENIPPIIAEVTKFVQVITGFITDLVTAIFNGVTSIIAEVTKLIDAVRPILLEIIGAFNNLVDKIMGFLNNLVDKIGPIIDSISGLVKELGEAISNAISTYFDGIEGLVQTLGDALTKIVDTVLNGIALVIEQIGKTIEGVIDAVVDGITRLADIGGGKLLLTAAGITAIAASLALFGAAQVAAAAGGGVGDVVGGIGKLFGGPGNVFDRLQNLADMSSELLPVGDAIKGIAAAMGEFGGINVGAAEGLDEFKKLSKTLGEGVTQIIGGKATLPNTKQLRLEALKTIASMMGSDLEAMSAGQTPGMQVGNRDLRDGDVINNTTTVSNTGGTTNVFNDAGAVDSALTANPNLLNR